MGVDGRLIQFAELATHISLHEHTGDGVVIETNEIKAEVYSADSLKQVAMNCDKSLHDVGCIVKVAGSVMQTEMASTRMHQRILGATSDLYPRFTVLQDREHLIVDTGTILAHINHVALRHEVIRVARLFSGRLEAENLEPVDVDAARVHAISICFRMWFVF